jgi:hypothetical protein
MKIFTGTVSHKHGTDTYMGSTEDALYANLYEFVSLEWKGVFDIPIPEDHREAVHYYFNNCQEAGEEDFLDDIGPTDIKAKLHCVAFTVSQPGALDTSHFFLGQDRNEAWNKANLFSKALPEGCRIVIAAGEAEV